MKVVRVGVVSIETDSDPSLIIDAPINQIIPLARTTYAEPNWRVNLNLLFIARLMGWSKNEQVRAISALTHAARRGDYPVEFWRSALWEWPDEARHRLSWLFGARLARLPSKTVVELRDDVFGWLRKHLPKLAAQDQPRALSIFDVLLEKLFTGEEEVEQSGEHQDRSRRTHNYVVSAPVDKATVLLLELLNSQGPRVGSSIPPEIKSRLERLFGAPGEGADHAVCTSSPISLGVSIILIRNGSVPRLSLGSTWSIRRQNPHGTAFSYDNQLPKPELFSLIKSDFLNAIVHAARWNWDDHSLQKLHEFLVLGCFWHQDYGPYITFGGDPPSPTEYQRQWPRS